MTNESDSSLRDRLRQAVRARATEQAEWLRKLAGFDTTRGNEAPCQDWLASEFAARGWSVDRYVLSDIELSSLPGFSPVVEADYSKALQVVATLPLSASKGRSLILAGHIDVVPPGPRAFWNHDPFKPEIADGFMTGRGVYDMKGGVAEMVFALDALNAIGLAPAAQIYVETISEEECTGNGALSTLARGYVADACLIPESTDGHLQRAQLGSVWFRLRVTGRAAHVLQTEQGDNAILGAYEYIKALQDLAARTSERAKASDKWFGHLPDPIKLSVGKIEGGDWIGMVPSWCEVYCRLGVLPGQDLADVRESIVKAVEERARQRNAAAPKVEWIGFQAEAYVLEPGGAAEETLKVAHEAVFNEPLPTRSLPATSDARQYGLYYGIPALCYGGKGRDLHGANERVDLDVMYETTVVLALFIAEWCGTVPIESQVRRSDQKEG